MNARARRFTAHRYDLDGHVGAVGIELELEHTPAATGRTFEEAKAALIDDLRDLLAEAQQLQEPTP